jgi:hypothetical protein
MFDIQEYRYPFESLFDFVSGGYWVQIEALHLTLGWIYIISFALYLAWVSAPLQLRLSIPYFALALFMNPAYEILGLKVNEVFGVLAALYAIAMKLPFPSRERPVASAILLVFALGFAHSLIAAVIYPSLVDEDNSYLMRVAVAFKVFVLGINLLIVGRYLCRGVGFDLVIKGVLYAGTFGLLMYVLQFGILLGSGTFPYGTYLDAGFVGLPTFGSVSEERGHFGKFMTPLFPFFLYALLQWRWRWRFALFVLVTCFNISASSLIFFFSYIFISLWVFRNRIYNVRALVTISVAFSLFIIFVINFSDVFIALIAKIYFVAILGDETAAGGRSVNTFLQYITTYPFGIGYGGSSLRTAPGLPEINSGFFAFISQYSFLALPIAIGYAWLIYATLRKEKAERTLLGKTMTIGVICSPIIFFSDILWFVPTIWLAFEIVWAVNRNKKELGVRRDRGARKYRGVAPTLPIASDKYETVS